MKLLVDECLSPELVKIANARGYEAAHAVHRGWGGYKDRQLMKEILEGDWTLVTNNAVDFRGPTGAGGHFGRAGIHAGLICLGCREGMDLDMQRDLFEAALDELDQVGDLVNKVLEVEVASPDDARFDVRTYSLPQE
jgi:hypothetical protein